MDNIDPLSVLKKILSKGDVSLYFDNHPGIGFDYSWVDLTKEEVNFLNRLLSDD